MAVVWSAICALAALAAGVEAVGEGPATRTRILPGHGYIRYQVLPGDDEAERGEVIVVHEDRRPAPLRDAGGVAAEAAGGDVGLSSPPRGGRSACSDLRAKLLARVFQVQGMDVEPEFAAWLERNVNLGTSGAKTIQLLGGDPLLITVLKADGVARALAEDLARCERR